MGASHMLPDAALETALSERRRLVEEALDGALPQETAWPETIHRAVRYSLFAGGKRIRPVLVLAAAEAVGGEARAAMPLACAVEMIHTYSLIHDDLPAMDDDDLRRGRPTSHKVFGEAIAILAGDALLTRAFHLLAELPEGADEALVRRRLAATAILGEACGTTGLVGGQVMDLECEGKDVAAPALERLHRAKTGALLSACVRGGALLGGAGGEDSARLSRYASAIGLAFQVVDDVLDAESSTATLGKTAGKDAKDGKPTYVSAMGVSRARDLAQELRQNALDAIAPFAERALRLRQLADFIVLRKF
jgi:geranylgeranyl diphosphate synthase type II